MVIKPTHFLQVLREGTVKFLRRSTSPNKPNCQAHKDRAEYSSRNRTISAFTLAISLFILLNVGISATYKYWHQDRFSSPNRSWIWWTVRGLQKEKQTPDILLLGSSLMMSVVYDGDATYLNQTEDSVLHHRCAYLEHLLKESSGKAVHAFSMAIGGQMASDAYAIVSTLFRESEKPKAIVYGIAPRDFIDCMFIDPASSETYRFMTRVGNPQLTAIAGHNTFWNRTESVLENAFFLYGKKVNFLAIWQPSAEMLVSKTLNIPSFDTMRTPDSLRTITKFLAPEDNGPNQWLANPYNVRTAYFRDNLPEYRKRYSLFKPSVYRTQIVFFERLLKYCQDTGIALVLVNMPLTPENIQVLPSGFYARYLANVSDLAHRYGAQFADLNQSGLFSHNEFQDSVHVNGLGANKFVRLLSAELSKESNLALGSRTTLK